MKCITLYIPLFAWLLGACGEFGPVPPPVPARVDFENQSQFELLELRVHEDLDYRGAKNLLDAPMLPGTRTSTVLLGPIYVTVFRERARGARTIAVTSDQPLDLYGGSWFELFVYDEAFRLMPRDSF